MGQIEAVLKDCGFVLLDKVRIQYVPDSDQLKEVTVKLEQALSSL